MALQAGLDLGKRLLAATPDPAPDLQWLWAQDPAIFEAQQTKFRNDEKFWRKRTQKLKAAALAMLAKTMDALRAEKPARLRFFENAVQAQVSAEDAPCFLINIAPTPNIEFANAATFWPQKIQAWQQRLAETD